MYMALCTVIMYSLIHRYVLIKHTFWKEQICTSKILLLLNLLVNNLKSKPRLGHAEKDFWTFLSIKPRWEAFGGDITPETNGNKTVVGERKLYSTIPASVLSPGARKVPKERNLFCFKDCILIAARRKKNNTLTKYSYPFLFIRNTLGMDKAPSELSV